MNPQVVLAQGGGYGTPHPCGQCPHPSYSHSPKPSHSASPSPSASASVSASPSASVSVTASAVQPSQPSKLPVTGPSSAIALVGTAMIVMGVGGIVISRLRRH